MLTSRKISETERTLKSFRELRWRSSTKPSNNKVKTFWVVRTNFRKEKFLMYLKMKFLIEGLAEDELQLLIDAPGVLSDNLFLDALRAIRSGISLRVLEQRLQQLKIFGLSTFDFSLNLYFTFNGTISYQMYLSERPIGKIKRFSGYVRNSSSVGSKRQSGTRSLPEHFLWNSSVEYDYFHFLTVGELTSGASGGSSLILKSSDRTKRKTSKSKRK